MVQDLVDPGVVVAEAEIARLDPQRLAHREERIEHELLRHHAERAARGAIVGADVVAQNARAAAIGSRRVRRESRSASSCRRRSAPAGRRTRPSRPSRSTPASACTLPKRRATSIASTALTLIEPGQDERADRRWQRLPGLRRAFRGGVHQEMFDAVDHRERAQRRGQAYQRQRAPFSSCAPLQRHHHGQRGGIGVRRARRSRRRPFAGSASACDASRHAAASSNVSAPANVQPPSTLENAPPRRRPIARRRPHHLRGASGVLAPRAILIRPSTPPRLTCCVELVAIVGDERHAADDDVVRLPAVRRLAPCCSRSAPAAGRRGSLPCAR